MPLGRTALYKSPPGPGVKPHSVIQERTGWRDQVISDRHRDWGYHCPMIDIDFVVIEYDTGEPFGLVEYKHERAEGHVSTENKYRALIALGNRARLPVFAARYAGNLSWWRVTPLNDLAKMRLASPAEMTERDYVAFLHKLRGREMDDDMFDANGVLKNARKAQ